MADVPLAWFASASGGCLFLWLRGRCDDGVRLAGLFACGMLLTKNEGIALYAVWLLATAVACTALCDARGRRAAALWLALVPAVVTAPWFAVRAGIPQLHEDYVSRLAPAVWWENVERIPTLAAGAWSYMREPADWLLLWPALALLLAGSVRVWRRRPELLVLLALAELPLLLYAGVFVITPWEPRVLLEAAAGRLLLHTFPLQLLLAAEITRSAGWLPWLRPAANAAGDAYRVGPTACEA
jgi:hypothetical protein